MFRSTFVVAALATSVIAQSAPTTPVNSQAGLLHFPVTCLVDGSNQTFDTTITATAPVYGGTGEEVYYSDVTVDIAVPINLVNLASIFGATKAQANVTIDLSLENATPSTIQAFSGTINNIPLQSGQVAHIKLPAGGQGTLPPVGPVTLGAAGSIHRIRLGEVTVNVAFEDSTGTVQGFPLDVSCGQQNVNYVIGSVQVNSTTGLAPLQPSASGLTYPSTPENAESGAYHIPYDCIFGPLGVQHLDIILDGTVPLYAQPGQSFDLSNGQAFLTVPAEIVRIAKIGWPNTTAFDTTVTNLAFSFANANPASLNIAATPIVSTVSIVGVTGDLTIPIPGNGKYLNVGPFTAGAAGTIASFQIGVANATTNLVDANGKVQYSLDVSCSVPVSLNLGAIVVTNQVPGNYSLT